MAAALSSTQLPDGPVTVTVAARLLSRFVTRSRVPTGNRSLVAAGAPPSAEKVTEPEQTDDRAGAVSANPKLVPTDTPTAASTATLAASTCLRCTLIAVTPVLGGVLHPPVRTGASYRSAGTGIDRAAARSTGP
ncbi:hypothetical protein GUI43_01701 [Micromonospora noduli]|nr:hypothetical protein GUI43_01701 [Micromonospora noduli]